MRGIPVVIHFVSAGAAGCHPVAVAMGSRADDGNACRFVAAVPPKPRPTNGFAAESGASLAALPQPIAASHRAQQPVPHRDGSQVTDRHAGRPAGWLLPPALPAMALVFACAHSARRERRSWDDRRVTCSARGTESAELPTAADTWRSLPTRGTGTRRPRHRQAAFAASGVPRSRINTCYRAVGPRHGSPARAFSPDSVAGLRGFPQFVDEQGARRPWFTSRTGSFAYSERARSCAPCPRL